MKHDLLYLLYRAGYLCEYCHTPLNDMVCELDHIWPISRQGLDIPENIATSCGRCNRNKGNYVEWIDRVTGRTLCLFNPRDHEWSEHFRIENSEVIGITPIGRATSALLFRQTPNYVPPDLQWGFITDVYDNQPLYYFLNHLRYQRIRNDFRKLEKYLTEGYVEMDLSPEERAITYFAKQLLTIELYFTRCRSQDISDGIRKSEEILGGKSISSSIKKEVENSLSILYQQAATLYSNNGDQISAENNQRIAFNYHLRVDPSRKQALSDQKGWRLAPEEATSYLRSLAMQSRFEDKELSRSDIKSYLSKIKDLDPYYNSAYFSYLIDNLLSVNSCDNAKLELLYDSVTENLNINGYGSGRDIAKFVTLRRRWWYLHLFLEQSPDWELLESDLDYWNRLSMFNELREFNSLIQNLLPRLSTNARAKVEEIIKRYR